MKSYYLLIAAAEMVTKESQFFKVAIGNSSTDKDNLQKLQFFANAKGYFLQKESREVDDFLYKIAMSLGMRVFELNTTEIGIAQMIRHIQKTGAVPATSPISMTESIQRQILDPAYRFQRQINVLRKAEAKQRNKPKVKGIRNHDEKSLSNVSPHKNGPSDIINF